MGRIQKFMETTDLYLVLAWTRRWWDMGPKHGPAAGRKKKTCCGLTSDRIGAQQRSGGRNRTEVGL